MHDQLTVEWMATDLKTNQCVPVALKAGTKFPAHEGFEKRANIPGTREWKEDFDGRRNIAQQLLDRHVDVDLEKPAVVALAPFLLPKTDYRYGRKGNPNSHWVYTAPNTAKTVKYHGADKEKTLLVELRTGAVLSTRPPSLHPSKETYEFVLGRPVSIAEAAEADYEELHQRVALLTLAAGVMEFYTKGARNDLAFCFGGILAKHQYPLEMAKAFIEAICTVAGDEEIAQRVARVEGVYAEAAEDTSKLPGYRHLEGITGPEFKRWVRKTLHRSAPVGGVDRADLLDVADYVADELGDDLLYIPANDRFYLWQETHWEPILPIGDSMGPLDVLVPNAMRAVGLPVTSAGKINEILRLAKEHLKRDLPKRPFVVNFKNGTLDAGTWTLRPHDKDDGLTYVMPYDFEEGECPAIDGFLAATVPDSPAIAVVEEHTGLAMLRDMKMQKSLLLIGPTRSGKTTIGDLACLACGEDPKQQPHADLLATGAEGRNSRARWHHQRLAHISEFPADAFREGEVFKAMAGHGSVAIRQLYEVEQMQNAWVSKLLMTANDPPRFLDPGGAIAQRLLVVSCPRRLNDKQIDPDLLERLAIEVPRWAARCLRRAMDLRRRIPRAYSESREMAKVLANLVREGDAIQGWALDQLAYDAESFIPSADLYSSYKMESAALGKAAAQWARVYQGIKTAFPTVVNDRRRIGSENVRGVVGVRFQTADDDAAGGPNDPDTDPTPPRPPFLGPSGVPPVPACSSALEQILPEGIAPFVPVNQSNDGITRVCAQAQARTRVDRKKGLAAGTKAPKKGAAASGGAAVPAVPEPWNTVEQMEQMAAAEPWTPPTWLGAPGDTALLALDTETAVAPGTVYDVKKNRTALDPHTGRLRLVMISDGEHSAVIDTWRHPDALARLRPYIEDARTTVVAHNASFDMKWLMKAGYAIGQNWADTMLMSQIHDGGLHQHVRGYHALKGLAARLLGLEMDKTEQTSDWSNPTLTEEQLSYAEKDAALLIPLYKDLAELLRADALWPTAELEHRALPAIALMEYEGFYVEPGRWTALAEDAKVQADALRPRIEETLGAINLNSPLQLTKALAELPTPILLESTDEAHLKEVEDKHPVIGLLLAYRKATKNSTTYGRPWLAEHVNKATDRVHPHYQQMVSTGRMSCASPNMQNIPRGTHRCAFTAPPGTALVKTDYSQIELRVGAMIAGEKTMLAAYASGEDLHKRTAAAVLGKPESEVTKPDRQLAKAVNFGLLYGMGAEKFRSYAKDSYGVELTIRQARQYRDKFFAAYPGLVAWHKDATSTAHESEVNGQRTGNVYLTTDDPKDLRTAIGRLRRKVTGYSQTLNTPVQGSAADGLKAAVGDLYADRARFPLARMVAVVHDEIVMECPVRQAEAVAIWVKSHMEESMARVLAGGVPVEAEPTLASDWGGTPLAVKEETIAKIA